MSGFSRHELEFCKDVTKRLIDHPLCKAYLRPVNPELDGAHDYFKIIKHPMDLGTIMKKLENNEYTKVQEWQSDIKLVWDNSKEYNTGKGVLHLTADKMIKVCNKIFKYIPKTEVDIWILKLSKANAKLAKFLSKPPSEESLLPKLPEYEIKEE